ncbi:MAG: hypothetical protein OZ948_17825 [Deltaproteobacteria bacterium]|nr:hypothetical protein [Deltaproteobacteria bacterium]
MQRNEQVIREFIAAWSRLDADELAAYFDEDGLYHKVTVSDQVVATCFEFYGFRFVLWLAGGPIPSNLLELFSDEEWRRAVAHPRPSGIIASSGERISQVVNFRW